MTKKRTNETFKWVQAEAKKLRQAHPGRKWQDYVKQAWAIWYDKQRGRKLMKGGYRIDDGVEGEEYMKELIEKAKFYYGLSITKLKSLLNKEYRVLSFIFRLAFEVAKTPSPLAVRGIVLEINVYKIIDFYTVEAQDLETYVKKARLVKFARNDRAYLKKLSEVAKLLRRHADKLQKVLK